MKIIVDRNTPDSRQFATVEIDTKHCYYPYAIRDAIQLALELDGYSKETINEVFNQMPDAKCEDPEEQITWKEAFDGKEDDSIRIYGEHQIQILEISDEEIEKVSYDQATFAPSCIAGARWYREQLKKK